MSKTTRDNGAYLLQEVDSNALTSFCSSLNLKQLSGGAKTFNRNQAFLKVLMLLEILKAPIV